MSTPFDLQAIIDRRLAIASEIERLTAEDKELETVVRVAQRFTNGAAGEATEGANKLGPPRPAGAPSLFEMVDTVLRETVAAGKPGLKGGELVAAIGKRFWPGVQARQIMPPIYGFAKQKRIRKGDSGIFKPV